MNRDTKAEALPAGCRLVLVSDKDQLPNVRAGNLLYTAVSRAKKLLVLIGAEKALRHAIRNHKPHLRSTHLMDRIVEMTEKGSHEEV